MRVLFITAYYPPCDYGWGYMRICEQVADGLLARGHEVAVLTSTYRHGDEHKPQEVFRLLPLDPDWHSPRPAAWQFFIGRRRREQKAITAFYGVVDRFKPRVIVVWHGHGLPRLLLREAERLPTAATAFYLANYLPEMPEEYEAYWNSLPASGPKRTLKKVASRIAMATLAREGKPIRLAYEHTISVSQHVRRRLLAQGLIGNDATVIGNGVDFAHYHQPDIERFNGDTIKFLIAGRVAPEKGIHTVLEAVALLVREENARDFNLTILGTGPAEYRRKLNEIVTLYSLNKYVYFQEPVPFAEMAGVYAQHDALILPSEWEEPLSCTMLEAMAAGLLVIGTATGGSAEALVHERTGLAFQAGDPRSLCSQITAALHGRERARALAAAGQQEARQNFSMNGTVSRMEHYLQGLASQSC